MKKLKTIGLMSLLFACIGLASCSSEDSEGTNTIENSKLAGTKWTLTDWDYSIGDEYIGLHDETYQFFFYSSNEGVFYYGRKDNYSDQGSSSQRIACHFKYKVSNNEVTLDYITDHYLSNTLLILDNNKLYANQLQFEKATISSTDTSWLNTIHGTTGACSWYSDMSGKLWIIGKGNMKDYTSYSDTPWAKNNRTPNEVVIDEGVTGIGSYSFANGSIIDVEMPDESLEKVGDAAFKGSLITSIYMSNSTTSIGSEAFANCTKLKQISIPENIVSIGDYAFSGCTSLNNTRLTFKESLKTIGDGAFESTKASSLTFEEGVEKIGKAAFLGTFCSTDKELTLPNSLTSIGATAFRGPFKKIVLGSGIVQIGEDAFISSATSGSMYINRSTPPTVSGDIIVENNNWTSAESRWTLYVPKGAKNAYKAKSPWNKFKSIVEDGD